MINRRNLLVSSILSLGGLGALLVHPALRTHRPAQAGSAISLPEAFGPWRALPAERVILPPADAQSVASYQQLTVGAYSDGKGPALVVLVASGALQTYALQLHRPEACYPSSGFTTLSLTKAERQLGGRPVAINWMEAKRGERVDRLLYWTRLGDRFTSDVWDQRVQVAMNAFRGDRSDGVLVRISAETRASQASDARIAQFANAWLEALPATQRHFLIGTTA